MENPQIAIPAKGRLAFIMLVLPGIALCGALLSEVGTLLSFFTSKARHNFRSKFGQRFAFKIIKAYLTGRSHQRLYLWDIEIT